jgi:hypothetical protein
LRGRQSRLVHQRPGTLAAVLLQEPSDTALKTDS